MTIPNNRASKNQRFVNGDVITPTEESLLNFCNEPKSRTEINEHFGLTSWTSWTHIKPLIASGKIKRTMPSIGESPRQRYTTQEVATPALTDETLREYCVVPRSRAEITKYFNLEPQYARRFIAIKAKENMLLMTKPKTPDIPSQRFYAVKL